MNKLVDPSNEYSGDGNTLDDRRTDRQSNNTQQQNSAISLPKGGGAIRGITEKFAANAVTGTSSLSIPLPLGAARGFQPEISLSYNSGSGNSEFGLGWNINLSSISRRTDKRLPTYHDQQEDDLYSAVGFDDLVPFLNDEDGATQVRNSDFLGITWEVTLYRPRLESNYQKIERWRQTSSNRIWWKTVSPDNVTTVFGYSDDACIFEPGLRAKTFKWFAELSYDDKGHVTQYQYSKENSNNIDLTAGQEQHRRSLPQANVYLKKVLHGVKQSRLKSGLDAAQLVQQPLDERDFHFQTVFDYGDHSELNPDAEPDQAWPAREDAFSSYRAGFEIRTYRRCQRVMLFHDFPELGPHPTLVSSIKLGFGESNESFSLLTSIEKSGHIRTAEGYASKSLPPMRFNYQAHTWGNELKQVDKDSLADMPAGIEASGYQWVDLYNEGLSGLIAESPGGLYYKQNQGQAEFSPAEMLLDSPSLRGLGSAWNFQDLENNGSKCLIASNGIARGYYQFDGDQNWDEFRAFTKIPNLALDDPNLRIIDLNGDGKADILVSNEHAFSWYASRGKQGYADSAQCDLPTEDGVSEIIFTNQSESIFLADMSGDGLNDIVRVRNGSIEYWPNMGYGKFGTMIRMANSPRFDFSDQFNPANIRLPDIDGSGPADVIYLGGNQIQYWLNRNGNSWSKQASTVNPFPNTDDLSHVSVVDFLGSGTACLVHSSSAPASKEMSISYVDLMQGKKPYLLNSYQNGFGKTVNLEYTPSTKFYLEDKKNGQPWITKLHFPVQCLTRVETVDDVSGTRFTNSYSYHHGYYDKAEREFRGFGRVDQVDTEAYDHFVKSQSSNAVEQVLHQTPVLTKTWFHLGFYMDKDRVLNQYQSEYFQHPDLQAYELSEPVLEPDLSPAERRQALRACKEMSLRSEVYGLDGTDLQFIPFTISGNTCSIRRVQAQAENKYAVFQVLNTESITFTLDRNPGDPRINHNILLSNDVYGRPTQSAAVSYGRKPEATQGSTLPQTILDQQQRNHCVVSEVSYCEDQYGPHGLHQYTNFEAPYRLPPAWQTLSYEYGLNNRLWSQGRLELDELRLAYNQAKQQNLVDYLRPGSDFDTAQALASEVRLLSAKQTRFASDQLNGELPAGQTNGLGISWQSYQLAFTPSLIDTIYGEKIAANSFAGGFVDLELDGGWWAPSGHPIYQLEANEAPEDRFYIPFGNKDSLGVYSWTEFDDYLLLPVASSFSRASHTDSPANLARINENIAINDYRNLNAKYMRDVNLNWVAVETDALGMVVKSAVMGKVENTDRNTPPGDDAVTEGDNLNNPSAIMDYAFFKAATDAQPMRPSQVWTRTFTQHFSQHPVPRDGLSSPLDYIDQYEYSDGSGNVLMTKQQTTPGMAKAIDENGIVTEINTGDSVRWIGNGRTIINNKGNPVKQYEPYFSASHEFEADPELVEIGVTPILFYDAAGRNICKLNPNKTYEKVVFDAWQQANWDVNDTLFLSNELDEKITDPRQDPDVGHFFSALQQSLVSPSWYEERISGNKGETALENQRNLRAARISETHAQTPELSYSDALGRTIYSIAHNRIRPDPNDDQWEDQHQHTQTILDIEGNILSIVDARDNTVMRYRYNMLPAPDEENPKPALYQLSMDAGEKWSSFDIQGKAALSWDSRDHLFEAAYDELHRPLASRLRETDQWIQIARQSYIDSDSPGAQAAIENNLLGSAVESFDQSGTNQILKNDFKGNVLRSKRNLAAEFKNNIDWTQAADVQLEAEAFFVDFEYDAVNRITLSRSPHNDDRPASESAPRYNESGALATIQVTTPKGGEKTYVQNIEYDAKGQRQSIEYGNGLITTYQYEADTYRLKQLLTKAGNIERQNLSYSYDPVGNITEIYDAAQSTIFFDNVAVEPHSQYEYDALYRLTSASGREHAMQANCPNPTQGFDALMSGNQNELQRYQQHYEYDLAGNIETLRHTRFGGNNRSSGGWTRSYQNDTQSNRLLSTELSCSIIPSELYSYNAHGSITSMAHLPSMQWNYAEQLKKVDLQGGGNAYYVYDSGGERTRKIVETNGSLVKERIYLGGWELYREHNASGLLIERETLHIMDDSRRIALVESKTKENNANVDAQPVIRYQLDNHLGSACWEIGDNLELISYEEYHPYGTSAYHAGNTYLEQSAKRYRYTGKERDEETGFSYHSARYLVCSIGRWLSSDPIGVEGGINLYAYALANPIILSDQSGTNPLSVEPAIGLYEKYIDKEYKALEKRVSAQAAASKGPINLSHGDLRTISEAMYFKGVASANSGVGYDSAMSGADSFLWGNSKLVSRDFIVDGVSYKGGEINYIGVGAFNIAYGVPVTLASPLISLETVAHNLEQFLEKGNSHEIPQTVFGIQWAQYGTFAAESLDAKIDFVRSTEINSLTDAIVPIKVAEIQQSFVNEGVSVIQSEAMIDTISFTQIVSNWALRPISTGIGNLAAMARQTPQGKAQSKRTGKELDRTKQRVLHPMTR